jgi:hypothetical protein
VSGPRFTILSRIDDTRFISACPHGMVHLTWERLTLRLRVDEFEALALLLGHAVPGNEHLPGSRAAGSLRLSYRPGDPPEVCIGVAALRLKMIELRQLAAAVEEARLRLGQIAASGEWDQPDPERPADPFAGLKQNPFSVN